MKSAKKIAAFTLTEMLIVLAITTIVVGLAFTIITLFGRNIGLIQNNYNQSTQLNLLEQQLTIDFNKFHNISYNLGSETLEMKTPLDSITYLFSEEIILRNLDTLVTKKYSKTFLYKGSETGQGRIDALKIEFSEGEKRTFLFFYKEMDAFQYITENGD